MEQIELRQRRFAPLNLHGVNLFFVAIILINILDFVEPQQLRYNKRLSKDVTYVLDNLLKEDKYDKRIRPNFGGDAAKITVNMMVKSMGPITESEESYGMDVYFRQEWVDSRLKFNISGLTEFSMNWLFLEKVWKPDTYFINGKRSYLHSITVPNKFLRLRDDGKMTYSMRLTVKARCPMKLRKFPLDSQTCPLEIGSYGYKDSDVFYDWAKGTPVQVEEDVNLAQYDLVDVTFSKDTRMSNRGDSFSVVTVLFHLKRHTGYFMLQVYVPCTLIVSCSWVSFWIDPSAVPARVSLGVTTVLTMTTLGFGGRSQMPKTSYATALDWFVILCFAFVFASMVEYAAINFMDKIVKDIATKSKTKKVTQWRTQCEREESERRSFTGKLYDRILNWFAKKLKDPWSVQKAAGSKFSNVDIWSRKIFPLSFALINTIYWTSFMYGMEDDQTTSFSKVQN